MRKVDKIIRHCGVMFVHPHYISKKRGYSDNDPIPAIGDERKNISFVENEIFEEDGNLYSVCSSCGFTVQIVDEGITV